MSEQIREQVSAFLDGELPGSETELLLKRLTRDAELRNSFGRYALVGEAMRGNSHSHLSRQFLQHVQQAIDGEPAVDAPTMVAARTTRWWRPLAGAAVAASVAAVAVVALQQRATSPAPARATLAAASTAVQVSEPVSYITPGAVGGLGGGIGATPAAYPAGRLTQYVFAHSKYSSVLGQSNVISGLLTDADEQEYAAIGRGAAGTAPEPRRAP